MAFVVRNIPASGLDGAFRIHLAPEAIQQAGLTFNEPCEISNDHGAVIGCGIAWRAADKMGASPKTKPARMSETMRDAFGIQEGSQVTLRPANTQIALADKIVLTDVTSSNDLQPGSNGLEDGRWRGRCTNALYNAEALAGGITFDVTAKKGVKRRFAVDSITGSAPTRGAQLYYVTDRTRVVLAGYADDALSMPSSPGSDSHGHGHTLISTAGIGGLIQQVEALNKSIRLALQQTKNDAISSHGTRKNWPVILHGYEGTGKSFLLDRASRCGFRNVFRLGKRNLSAGATSKNESIIANIFDEARAHQPSLILMDDVHRLAPAAEDGPYRELLCEEVDKIAGSRVLVIAATRSLQDVHSKLMAPGRFIRSIELPIPDLNSRKQVLSALISPNSDAADAQIEGLSSRTHGFTCSDLAVLVDKARVNALVRSPLDEQPAPTNGAHPNGEIGLDEDDKSAESPPASRLPCEEDWNLALNQVRPAALREIFFETPKIKWSDIGGSQTIQAQFDEIIGWPLHHPEVMKQSRLPPQKGMLLYGPPGCSKTLTAQAVAATYAMNFIAVKGAELVSMYVGESERSVREIFRKARTARPCIIFFDEIDSIAAERDAAGTKGLNVLTTLLNEMDGFESLDGVLVLAATNKPEVLDPAIMRPGRFDQHLYLPPPSDVARKEIFELHISTAAREDDLDVGKLVKSTHGYTGAEVVAVCNQAKRMSIRRQLSGQGSGTLRMDDFESALTDVPPRITREVLEAYENFGRR